MRYSKMVANLDGKFNVPEIQLRFQFKQKASERVKVSKSSDAYTVLLNTWNKDLMDLQEQFRIIFLDGKLRCLGISTISTGGMSAALVDPRLIFIAALKIRAVSIILAHNHPSGISEPSVEDQKLTDTISKMGKVLDIPVSDHIIVTRHGYTSFVDNGLKV